MLDNDEKRVELTQRFAAAVRDLLERPKVADESCKRLAREFVESFPGGGVTLILPPSLHSHLWG